MNAPLCDLVLPMAGAGSRFTKAGVTTPKPLVLAQGRPLFYWGAMSVLRAVPVRRTVAVLLEEHVRNHAMDRAVRELLPDAELIVLERTPFGSAWSCQAGLEGLDGDLPVAFADCDQAFGAPDLAADVGRLDGGGLDAVVPCFRADSPAYSYGDFAPDLLLRRVVEKVVISPWALAGVYAFSSSELFNRLLASAAARAEATQELYMSALLDCLLSDGGSVLGSQLSWHAPLGTPEELAAHAGRPELESLVIPSA